MDELDRPVKASPEVLEALWGWLDRDGVGSKELTEYARDVHGLEPPNEPGEVAWTIGVAFPDDGPDRGVLWWIGREKALTAEDR